MLTIRVFSFAYEKANGQALQRVGGLKKPISHYVIFEKSLSGLSAQLLSQTNKFVVQSKYKNCLEE